MAVALLVVFPIVALTMRDRPESIGLRPYGATVDSAVPERSAKPFRPALDGLALGLRSRSDAPATADMLTADTLGKERVGIVFGWIFASHQFGAAAAAWIAGATRGWFGSYTFAFLSAGATCLFASLLVTQIRLPGARRRRWLSADARLALAGRDGAA